MLDAIRNCIEACVEDWGLPDSRVEEWQPIFRSNINYNFVEEYPLITRIIFWVDSSGPKLVSKILDKSLSPESLSDCLAFQQSINKKLGCDLYPQLYGVTEINGYYVLFEPAIRKSTYETELKRAVFGAEASPHYVGRVITRQFAEIGGLFNTLLQDHPSDTGQWGQNFYDLGDKLRKMIDGNVLTIEHLNIMKQNIDAVAIYDTPVLADLVCPNIFAGPQLIDNLIPDIKGLNKSLPGIINAFRFIVPCFYSPPLTSVLQGWVQALAGSLMDKAEVSLLAKPVRDLCRQVGLDPDAQRDIIWSLIMGATFFEMVDKLDFYNNSPFMLQGKQTEYLEWIRNLVSVQEAIK